MQTAIEEIGQLILQESLEAVFEVDLDDVTGATWVTALADLDPGYWDDVVDKRQARDLNSAEQPR